MRGQETPVQKKEWLIMDPGNYSPQIPEKKKGGSGINPGDGIKPIGGEVKAGLHLGENLRARGNRASKCTVENRPGV